MNRRIAVLTLLGAAAVLGGCAAEQRTTVSDSDLGRLGSSQVGPIERAQSELQRAQQAKAQAEQKLSAAEDELSIARPGTTVAKGSIDEARAELDRAKRNGDPRVIDAATRRLSVAHDYDREESARTAFFEQNVAARKADAIAAEKRVDLATAELQKSRLEALREAHNPAANKYQGWRFDKEVSDRSGTLVSANQEAMDARQKARAAFDQWQSARAEYLRAQGVQPARGGGPLAPPPMQMQAPRRAQPNAPQGGPQPDAEPDMHE
ncbi:MAG: hypothetical protein ACYCWW_18010 [Deltaproteobacteria bacterium]